MPNEAIGDMVSRILLEYAQSSVPKHPLAPATGLRQDLGIESLTLVAVVLRLGEELNVDVVETGIEMGGLETVGDVTALARALNQTSSGQVS